MGLQRKAFALLAATALLVGSGSGRAQTPASDLLQKAVFMEETEGRLDEAMKMYEQIVRDADASRPAVAQAYFRLGAAYEKKQMPKEARFVFENLVARYADQGDLAVRAKERLARLGSGEPGGTAEAAGQPPSIVSITPRIGARDVDPALDKITVVFDKDMAGGFSWTGGGPEFPENAGSPSWKDKRTCILPVKLQPGKFYRLGLNSTSFQNFRSAAGVPLVPVDVYFTTRGADARTQAQLQAPTVVNLDPPSGATDVDPARQTISITFDQKMGGGMSWCGGGPDFPESAGDVTWDESRRICTMPVKLKPGHEYRIGVNCPSFRNFKSAAGIPVEPQQWTFRTR